MPNIKNRILTLALAGLMAGQAILPVSAAENTDPAQSTENTEAGIMLIDEAGTDDGDTAETTDANTTAPAGAEALENSELGETTASDTDTIGVDNTETLKAGETDAENAETDAADAATTETVADDAAEDLIEVEEADTASAEDAQAEEIMLLADDETETYSSSSGDYDEKIYSVDPFDADYSAGYFCVSDADAHGALEEVYDGVIKNNMLIGYNTERSDDIYIDHHDGVCINGTYYDVREYVWMSEDSKFYLIDLYTGLQGGAGSADGNIHREFHFYEAGTLDTSNPVEVSFRGVMHLTDMDINEGYTFDQGLVGVWVNSETRVSYRGDLTWKGTVENGNTPDEENLLDAIWVEVEGTPEHPLTYTYWYNRGHYSHINYAGNTITYELVADGTHALPEGAEPAVGIHCATYAEYSLMPEAEFKYYAFDGWYYDKALTQKVPDTIMVAEDHTFYGTYHKVAGRIDTEVVNGSITDAINEIAYGKDAEITYQPDNGCILESVTVDGETVDPETFQSRYDFANIQEDHKISVVYVKTEAPVKVVYSENGEDINGDVLTAGETVSYRITVKNPASTARDFTITDQVPDGMEFVSAANNGTCSNDVVTWRQTVEAHDEFTVSYKAQVMDSAKGHAVSNIAKAAVSGVTCETNEVENYVLTEPVKAVKQGTANVVGQYITDGEEITYTITVSNPSDSKQDIAVTDTVSNALAIGKVSDNGKIDGQKVTWTLKDVAAHSSRTVSITAAAIGTDKEQTVDNTAQMTIDGHTLTSNNVRILIPVKPKVTTRETTVTNKTVNNETENNVIENNKTISNETKNNTDTNPVQATETTQPADTTATTANGATITGYRNVNTGDMARTGLLLAIAGAAAIGLGVYYYKRRH